MIVGVIGLGLIGGSMAIDLKRNKFADIVLGVDSDTVNASAAAKIGLVDEIVDFETCVQRSDIVIISIPVGSAIKVLPKVLDIFMQNPSSYKVVLDTCSTKAQIVQSVHYHPFRARYVGTHPMSGTEYSGPWAAMPNLFNGTACIFANFEDSDPKAVNLTLKLYEALNMRPVFMSADSHDVHTAYVSHLSHVLSFALALTVLDKEKDEKHIFDLASGGFASTVRLAKSNADMWTPIFEQNRDNLLRVIDSYMDKMGQFREAISEYDHNKIRSLIEEANRIKKIIK